MRRSLARGGPTWPCLVVFQDFSLYMVYYLDCQPVQDLHGAFIVHAGSQVLRRIAILVQVLLRVAVAHLKDPAAVANFNIVLYQGLHELARLRVHPLHWQAGSARVVWVPPELHASSLLRVQRFARGACGSVRPRVG